MILVLAAARPAFADDAAELAKMLATPSPNREAAAEQPPPWCTAADRAGKPGDLGYMKRTYAGVDRDWHALFDAARAVCGIPDQPMARKVVASIHQTWINITGMSANGAMGSLRARLAVERWNADKAALCDALVEPTESEGEDRSFMRARRKLFGCVPHGYREKDAMWVDNDADVDNSTLAFLDQSGTEADELVKLAVLVNDTRGAFGHSGDVTYGTLARYVVDQLDMKALSTEKLDRLLDGAPYKGNTYAITVAHETYTRMVVARGRIEATIATEAKDPDWKRLLVDAPAAGIAAWQKAADTWKAELARSNAFEHAMFGPSRKAMQGCMKQLRPDIEALMKTLPHASEAQLRNALSSHAFAGMMFVRLGACAAVDGEKEWASTLLSFARKLRFVRGPRIAAYYAALPVLEEIKADREKFPIGDLYFFKHDSDPLLARAEKLNNGVPSDAHTASERGTIVSTSGGVVRFVTAKHQETKFACTPTNKISRIREDGKLEYEENCVPRGLETVDDTTPPVTIPAKWAAGLAPGVVLEFRGGRTDDPSRTGMPTAAYSDKSKAKLVNFLGFGL